MVLKEKPIEKNNHEKKLKNIKVEKGQRLMKSKANSIKVIEKQLVDRERDALRI